MLCERRVWTPMAMLAQPCWPCCLPTAWCEAAKDSLDATKQKLRDLQDAQANALEAASLAAARDWEQRVHDATEAAMARELALLLSAKEAAKEAARAWELQLRELRDEKQSLEERLLLASPPVRPVPVCASCASCAIRRKHRRQKPPAY